MWHNENESFLLTPVTNPGLLRRTGSLQKGRQLGEEYWKNKDRDLKKKTRTVGLEEQKEDI